MKKLNKKGSTLLELVISITLISVVLVFLMRLLVDLNASSTSSDYAKDNQINRAEILRVIQNDLNNNTIKGISDEYSSDNLKITFTFEDDKKGIINATSNKFTYTSSSNKKRTWTMKDCVIYTKKASINKRNTDEIYTLEIDIEIHTNNDNNKYEKNNFLDDILITYIGKVSDFT